MTQKQKGKIKRERERERKKKKFVTHYNNNTKKKEEEEEDTKDLFYVTAKGSQSIYMGQFIIFMGKCPNRHFLFFIVIISQRPTKKQPLSVWEQPPPPLILFNTSI